MLQEEIDEVLKIGEIENENGKADINESILSNDSEVINEMVKNESTGEKKIIADLKEEIDRIQKKLAEAVDKVEELVKEKEVLIKENKCYKIEMTWSHSGAWST